MKLHLPSLLAATFLMAMATNASAKLKVIASTTDVAAIVRAVAGDLVDLETLARGTQDPHYLEAKPSYMVKMAKADALFANGLSLEVGWLPSLVQGARNPKIAPGQSGYLELGTKITPIDVHSQPLTRAAGDVHPDGNPHFTLDPLRLAQAARAVAERLGELDSSHKETYVARAADYEKDLTNRMKGWQERIKRLPSKTLVVYHASLNYFIERFALQAVAFLEPKPGIPPSAAHILEVIAAMKRENTKAILVDNYFDTKIAERIAREVPGASVQLVGVAVEAKAELRTNADVIEQLIVALEKAK